MALPPLGECTAVITGASRGIDCWVNNAGVLEPIAPLREIGAEDFRRHIDVNLTGVFLGTRALLRHRRARGGGGMLLNVCSGAAQTPMRAGPPTAPRRPASIA